ncbi:MAG: hypothetical protein JXK93_05430 [Sphaerochaetaceae bacterium]|nr:hypothetical protein [Sphaerochaetaceae bacterium]
MVTGGESRGNEGRCYYYWCYKHDCHGLSVRKHIIESLFWRLLKQARLNPELLVGFKEVQLEVWEEHHGDTDQEGRYIHGRQRYTFTNPLAGSAVS